MPDNIDVVLESTFESHIQENRRVLWQGLLAGPVIYALYFITVYLIAEAACHQDFLGGTVSGLPLLSVVVLIITLAAAFCTFISGLSNFQRWRRQQARPAQPTADVSEVEYETANPETSLTFMAFGGLLLSILFTTMILYTGIPTLVLQVCVWV
ncbi:MAG: hypothetical protein KDE19_01070 [Caldilineaceae bacterium]|nr:hypothetical protein [Caldilineaceae bacterium]